MIRAVFLDVDGTLVSIKTHRAAPRTRKALLGAKARGVRLFLATGRHLRVREESYVLEELPDCFDGYVALTGQYCYTVDGTVVLKAPLNPEDVRAVKALGETHRIPYSYCYEDAIFISRIDETVRRHNKDLGLPLPEIREMEPARDVYGITLYLDAKREAELLRPRLLHSTTVGWVPGIYDIAAESGGKQAGIMAMLRHFAIAAEETMAVGDSDNDVSMLQNAGFSVAMANGTPAVLAAADYVTAACEDDGVYHAFLHCGLI